MGLVYTSTSVLKIAFWLGLGSVLGLMAICTAMATSEPRRGNVHLVDNPNTPDQTLGVQSAWVKVSLEVHMAYFRVQMK